MRKTGEESEKEKEWPMSKDWKRRAFQNSAIHTREPEIAEKTKSYVKIIKSFCNESGKSREKNKRKKMKPLEELGTQAKPMPARMPGRKSL
jgi:predicted ribonuclease toxin of YeeF-YezG toxin-antitoxin module